MLYIGTILFMMAQTPGADILYTFTMSTQFYRQTDGIGRICIGIVEESGLFSASQDQCISTQLKSQVCSDQEYHDGHRL